jgi:hypothetical protein
MNRVVSSNDLTRLSEKAWGLAKLAESARRVSCDLDADKRDKQDVQNAVKRCRERLHERNITKKQRRKLERKLEFYDEADAQATAAGPPYEHICSEKPAQLIFSAAHVSSQVLRGRECTRQHLRITRRRKPRTVVIRTARSAH